MVLLYVIVDTVETCLRVVPVSGPTDDHGNGTYQGVVPGTMWVCSGDGHGDE